MSALRHAGRALHLRTYRVLLLAATLLASCRARAPAPIDLGCDVIRFDAVPDRHRLEGREVPTAESALAARDRARLTVRGFAYADSAVLPRLLSVTLTHHGTSQQTHGPTGGASVTLEPEAGPYVLRVTCLGCSRADTTLILRAGHVYALHAYLTQFPGNCEGDERP